jgi:hypothetical protein
MFASSSRFDSDTKLTGVSSICYCCGFVSWCDLAAKSAVDGLAAVAVIGSAHCWLLLWWQKQKNVASLCFWCCCCVLRCAAFGADYCCFCGRRFLVSVLLLYFLRFGVQGMGVLKSLDTKKIY